MSLFHRCDIYSHFIRTQKLVKSLDQNTYFDFDNIFNSLKTSLLSIFDFSALSAKIFQLTRKIIGLKFGKLRHGAESLRAIVVENTKTVIDIEKVSLFGRIAFRPQRVYLWSFVSVRDQIEIVFDNNLHKGSRKTSHYKAKRNNFLSEIRSARNKFKIYNFLAIS